MKVLLINDSGTPTAGAEIATLALREGLRRRGHDVRVFASRASSIPGNSFADVSCFGTTTRLQTLSSLVNPSAVATLRRELALFGPDVVHITMFMWQLSPAILPLLKPIPSVYFAVTLKAVCPTGSKRLPSGLSCENPAGMVCYRHGCLTAGSLGPLLLQQAFFRRGYTAFDRIVAASEAVRRRMEAGGLRVDEVIHPASRPLDPVPAQPGDVPRITYVGRLVADKGVDVLLRAFREVRIHVPEATLRVIGAGRAEEQLKQLAADLGLGDAVEWPGACYGDELFLQTRDAWVHAVPSQWEETFGLTTTDAMLRGTAVVATDLGGSAEIVRDGETGFLVPPASVGKLARALIQLLRCRDLAVKMGIAGRKRAGHLFTADVMVERFLSVYEALRT